MDTLPEEDESRDQMLSIESKTYKVIMKDLVDSDEKNKVAVISADTAHIINHFKSFRKR